MRRWNWTAGWNVPGRGTFVAEPKRVLVRQLTSYTQDLQSQGLTPSTRFSASAESGRRRGCAATQPATWNPGAPSRAVRGVSGEPLAHDVAYLAGSLPRLRQELERRGSLYQTLREAYGVRLVRVEDLVETSLADPTTALLSVDVGLPMLLIHRTAWDVEDRPVEFTRTVFPGDRFSFISHSTVDDGIEPAESRQG